MQPEAHATVKPTQNSMRIPKTDIVSVNANRVTAEDGKRLEKSF